MIDQLMKYLVTPILEFVLAQPAHKLPVVFTLEECPLPDCSESSEDVLGEVLRLQKEGWIEAHVTRGVTGKPKQVEVRYVTLPGRNYLESRNTRGQVNNPASALIRWGITGLVVMVLVLLWVFGRHASSPREEQHAPAVSDLPGDTSAPISLPTSSPEPSATPDVSTSPVLAPSPTATPTPEPVASPTPSPHRKRVQR
jgi:hypothetical protein